MPCVVGVDADDVKLGEVAKLYVCQRLELSAEGRVQELLGLPRAGGRCGSLGKVVRPRERRRRPRNAQVVPRTIAGRTVRLAGHNGKPSSKPGCPSDGILVTEVPCMLLTPHRGPVRV
jgi:hypothetical protein